MTPTRRLTPLLPTLLFFFVACNTGAPEQDVQDQEIMTGDTAGDAHIDTADDLFPDILPADILEVAEDLPQDLPEEILEEILEVIPTEVETPCESHVECDDGDPCTGDFCEDGACVHQVKNCGDGNECTEDLCDPETSQCAYELKDCDDGNECTLDSCKPATGCEYIELSDCCPPEVIELWDMEAEVAGLQVTNLEPEDSAAVTWQLSSERAWSGSQSLYFGDPATLTYDSGHRVRASALLPAVTVPEGFDVELRMNAWLDVEDGFDWDAFTVYVVWGDLRVPMLVKTYQTKYEEWQEWVVLLNAFAGKDIQLEIFFDSVDGGGNTGEGIYVDDVRVAARCPIPETCFVAVDCNDQALCTTDSCDGGLCVYEVNPICCLSQAHCLDDDPCSIDHCDDGSCSTVTVAPPFCCYTDEDCEDQNECTDDVCYEGACFHPPSDAPGCCEEDSDCDDGLACTIDSCKYSSCVNINICCYSDDECDDDDVCTTDTCEPGDPGPSCQFIYTPGCCTTAFDCDDGNACTEDICPGVGEQCQNPAIEGCCFVNGECADEDVCTIDTCTGNVCVHTPAEECCYDDVTCDDDNPCSSEYCDLEAMPNAVCVYNWIPDCCFVDEDCEDGNPCTEDVCPSYGELCTNEWIDGCCLKNSDCADTDECTWDLCVDNECAYVNLCCTIDEECDDGDDVCTDDACVDGSCVFAATGVDGCCSAPLFRDDFSEDLSWQYGPNWERGEATASSGSVYNDDPANDHSTSDDDFIAGVIIGGMAPTNLGGFYWLTSPEIDISQAAQPHISYWRWLNSDYTPYMQNKVEVYNGSTWVNLWTTGGPPGIADSSWTHHDYNVTSHKNAAFRIRIGYIISSGGVYTISSWNLDDVQVYDAAALAANANLCCTETSDCQGIVPGTACTAGECQ